MIDWSQVLFNAFWILGFALILAGFSHAHWLAHTQGARTQKLLGAKTFQLPFSVGLFLVSLGLFFLAGGWLDDHPPARAPRPAMCRRRSSADGHCEPQAFEQREENEMKKFEFTITISVDLTEEEVWPDGDAPENPTAADAREVFVSCNGSNYLRTAREWSFENDIDLEVCEVQS